MKISLKKCTIAVLAFSASVDGLSQDLSKYTSNYNNIPHVSNSLTSEQIIPPISSGSNPDSLDIDETDEELNMKQTKEDVGKTSRRGFFGEAFKTSASIGLGVFGSNSVAALSNGHLSGCACRGCLSLGPLKAMAYERDVGGPTASADTKAFNIQARETNARLERDGFKLDTKEEEAKRLSEAFTSFSYDDNTFKQQKKQQKTAKIVYNSNQTK